MERLNCNRFNIYLIYIHFSKNMKHIKQKSWKFYFLVCNFSYFEKEKKAYFICLLDFIQHHNAVGILVINHSPKIDGGVWQGHLSNDEGIFPPITLEWERQRDKETTYMRKRKKLHSITAAARSKALQCQNRSAGAREKLTFRKTALM